MNRCEIPLEVEKNNLLTLVMNTYSLLTRVRPKHTKILLISPSDSSVGSSEMGTVFRACRTSTVMSQCARAGQRGGPPSACHMEESEEGC